MMSVREGKSCRHGEVAEDGAGGGVWKRCVSEGGTYGWTGGERRQDRVGGK